MSAEYCDICQTSIPYDHCADHEHFQEKLVCSWCAHPLLDSPEYGNQYCGQCGIVAPGLEDFNDWEIPSCEDCNCTFSLQDIQDYRFNCGLGKDNKYPEEFPRVCAVC
jgi:hypothetical protein